MEDQHSKRQLPDQRTDEENKNVRPANSDSLSMKDEIAAALDKKNEALRSQPDAAPTDHNQNDGDADRADSWSVSWP
jgi:hypothetical protein